MAKETTMTSTGSGSAFPAMAVAATLVLTATSGTAASHAMTNCSVSAMEGAPVRLQVAGQWSALEPGPLPDGAEAIATGPAARAEITCDADLVVTIGAGTEVSLDALTQASDPAILRLLRGILGIDAPTPAFRGFEVQTPLAIASARSTSWMTEYGAVTGTAVFVRSGSVEVTSAERQPLATLDEGEGVTIVPGPDGALPDPDTINVLEWGPARIDAAAASLGFGWR
jgi:ferric-dicitrate binding protein FerR (iron transport regulator)